MANRFSMTDEEIIQPIIYQSIARYPGVLVHAPITDPATEVDAVASAYSRLGGYNTICFTRDITCQIIDNFRGAR